jgi:uncharacterized membrane protein
MKEGFMDINQLSIIELKQLLSRVNQDINSIKRAERRAKKIAVNNAVSELAECNIIAKRFTGKIIPAPIQNAKLIADIQIQKDILDYLNNGGRIITAKRRKSSKAFTVSLSNQVSL